MKAKYHPWIRISIFNLVIVAAIGTVLRYKIAFSLPFIDQKHLLHGHSHFAFAGWVTQLLMTLLVHALAQRSGRDEWIRYRFFLWANLLTAYGMLIAFPIQGYAATSIICSTLSIFVSYGFAIQYWRDLNAITIKLPAFLWFKAALLFNTLSSVGAFSLAYMMANKMAHQDWYLGAVYFFLHFQYNGWFFFGLMGLLHLYLQDHLPYTGLRRIFWIFALSCVPAYFLSALWMPIPIWVYVLVVVAALLQVSAWAWLLQLIYKNPASRLQNWSPASRILISLSAVALTVKLLLQLGSTIPALSQLAFGFRPVVIGYLHLVLLGVVSIFLLGYILSLPGIHTGRLIRSGCTVFVGAIILNELGLMVQGIAAMGYHSLPGINIFLLAMALLLFLGSLLIWLGWKPDKSFSIGKQ